MQNMPIDNVGTRRVYLHSPRSDFAETQWLSEVNYLGRSLRPSPRHLTLAGCGCGTKYLVRIKRAGWMRLLPLVRLYECLQCNARILRRTLPYRTRYGAAYLAPAPLRPVNQRLHAVAQLTSALVREVRP
jgi:hypothetical protein